MKTKFLCYVGAVICASVFSVSAQQEEEPPILNITADGKIGIGTQTPQEVVEVANGNVKMGYERVSTACPGTGVNCDSVCPADKYVIGGGCWGSNGSGGNIQNSTPISDTTWRCRMTGSFELTYTVAICANMR